MRVAQATDRPGGKGKLLFYEIRTNNDSYIGSAIPNACPLNGDSEITLDEAKKNALLWAAAPELLEALEAMMSVYPAGGSGDAEDRHKAVEKAKAAIKKAKGL